MTNEQRSAERIIHDENSKDIKALIMETPDPKDKAVLMILLKISDDLFRNTQITSSLSEKFEKHVATFIQHAEDEMKLINTGRGFLRGIIFSIAMVQALIIFIFSQHMQEFSEMQQSVKHLEKEVEAHKEHHRTEEKYKNVPRVSNENRAVIS